MPSSTFSSERLPHTPLLAYLQASFLIFLLAVLGLELGLALRGIRPNRPDSESLWLHERARADTLGSRALVLIGGSRILLDTDLPLMRQNMHGLEPVQLAIDGASFLPVLRGLAQDRHFTGNVIIDFNDYLIDHPETPATSDFARNWAQDFVTRRPWALFTSWNDHLEDLLRTHLRAYADGSSPWDALAHRVLARTPYAQYLKIHENRSVDADYRKLPERQLYISRISQTLGVSINASSSTPFSAVNAALYHYIDRLKPHDPSYYPVGLSAINAEIDAIRARGGQVVVIVSPTSGVIHAYLEQQNPRPLFWDVLQRNIHAATLRMDDKADQAGLICPDGSHLDQSEKPFYTQLLIHELQSVGLGGASIR